ncbi:MAG TPA: SGNH/GDSL hydrolase family protein [Gemmatimonadaceae bacterium]|nr:SGNH/GDSL hydrolase family protein [Gemmatimonadaceae bacterium]
MKFARYVAIGDSSTEGLDDPDGHGGYRGWANRLAEHVARAQGSLLYANLAVRGLRTRQILERQLEPALALQPDLVTVFAGTNDVVRPGFNADAVARAMEQMQRSLVTAGARVLTFTLPDLSAVMPVARFVAPRVRVLNDALRQVAATTGASLVDVAAHPVAADPRLWSEDRLHANSEGHARIAAALADALGLPGIGETWTTPLPPLPPATIAQRLAAEVRWSRRYFSPWIWRRVRGRSSADGRSAKQPTLQPVPL